jgi:hypothetical protein
MKGTTYNPTSLRAEARSVLWREAIWYSMLYLAGLLRYPFAQVRSVLVSILTGIIVSGCISENSNSIDILSQGSIKLSKTTLQDKIKGGWAGQTIGVVYGAPVEFKYQGSLIDDKLNIPWNEHYVKYWWDKKPGLFDDIYTDLNFVKAFEKHGLNASSDSIAHHWSNTAYHLAHANQASRYNILNGIMPPASGKQILLD